MLSRLFDRSVRWLTASLAIAALVTALAVPVQAAPRSESGDTDLQTAIVDWVERLVRPLAVLLNTEPEETDLVDQRTAPSGQCMDPNGQPVQCPEPD